MKRLILLLLISVIFYGCNSYENKDQYELKVGEIVNLYYETNSCCYYCLSNKKELKHTKLVERKTVEGGLNDCIGCNYTAAFIFEAESVGIDTVKIKHLGAKMDCDNNDVEPEKYIIKIE